MDQTTQQLSLAAKPPVPNAGRKPPAPAASASNSAAHVRIDHLSGTQKAAIVVRVLLAEGLDMPISSLPFDMQTALTQAIGSMRLVDRATMNAVVEEFVDMLEQVGMSFPEGLEGALSLLDDKLDDRAKRQLRAMMRSGDDDPWVAVEMAEDSDIMRLIDQESMIVGAVILSKLSTEKAARLLAKLPSEQAQALALAISRTENIAPDAVKRIGTSLAMQVQDKPERAFEAPPSKRVGEILNSSAAALRDALLEGLESADTGFAQGVRKSIFTFQDIPARISERDVPTIMRDASGDDLMAIIAAQDPADTAALEFILTNMSKRMAETLREDATALPQTTAKQRDAAMSAFTGVIRRLIDAGTIKLVSQEDEEE